MKLYAFSLFDVKATFFNVPFFVAHRGLAVRMVMEMCADMRTTVARHPNDFVLFELGAFDDQTGALLAENPLSLGPVGQWAPKQASLELSPEE